MNLTLIAAEAMLGNGWYTAASLGAEIGLSAKRASGLLFNIRSSKKYQVEVTDLPNRQVKVIAIDGRTKRNFDLWRTAIFGCKAVGYEDSF